MKNLTGSYFHIWLKILYLKNGYNMECKRLRSVWNKPSWTIPKPVFSQRRLCWVYKWGLEEINSGEYINRVKQVLLPITKWKQESTKKYPELRESAIYFIRIILDSIFFWGLDKKSITTYLGRFLSFIHHVSLSG